MESFEDLGLNPELVEALSAEGIEEPTPLQEASIPVVRRGNPLILAAGPGAGVMVAWAAGLLEKISTEGDAPIALVLTPTAARAEHLAVALGRMAMSTGHAVAALGGHWALPERAQILCATPRDLLTAAKANSVSLEAVEACIVDDAAQSEVTGELAIVESILEYLSRDVQKVLTALPVTAAVTAFADKHMKRSMTLPAEVTEGPKRGEVHFRVTAEPREDAVLSLVSEMLADDARHVLVYCRSEDRAADVGDFLTLHGFMAGAPGDTDLPVWLGVDALEARPAIEDVEGVRVVSCDTPTDPDTLDRRHARHEGGVVVVLVREIAHFRDLARRTGYTVAPSVAPDQRSADAARAIRATIREAIEKEDTAPYLLALEELFVEFDPTEVAAAAVALLRKRQVAAAVAAPTEVGARSDGAMQAWVKLFFTVGERDGLSPADLLGAMTGEAGVTGSSVGRIEIRESHSVVEVHDEVARKIIQALNGTTIRGRAVRADFDRPKRTGARDGGGRGGPPRGGPPRGGPRSGGPRSGGGSRPPGGPRS